MINCEKIPLKDKGCHIIAGFVIAIIVTYSISPLWGVVAGVSAGLVKEAYDEYSYGGAEFFDFFATVLGTVAAIFTYGILDIWL